MNENKFFEITGLGRCLVGTYTLRKLTKHFDCSPEYLLVIGYSGGNQLEFLSYLIKYSYENALIQSGGHAALIDKSVEEIDLALDLNPIMHDKDKLMKITNAIWLCVHNKTFEEFSKELEEAQKKGEQRNEQPEEEKKSLTTLPFGENWTNTLGGQTLVPNSSTV